MPKVIKGGVRVEGFVPVGNPVTDSIPVLIGAHEKAAGNASANLTAHAVTTMGIDKIALDVFLAGVTPDTEISVSQLPDPATSADATVNSFISAISTWNMVFNGTTWDRVRGDIANGIDVDVTRIAPGTGATDLGKAEDSVSASGDVGIALLGVRRDTLATLTSATGDYSHIATDQYGQMRTTDIGVNAAIVDGTQLTGVYDVDTGQKASVLNTDAGTSDLGLVVRTIPNQSIDTPVTGSVTVTQATASNLKAQIQGTNAAGAAPPTNPVYIGMKDIATGFNVSPHVFNFGGIDYQVCLTPDPDLQFEQYNANGESYTLVGSTDNTLANARYLKTDSSGNVMVVGNVAHDAADSGNPVKIGGKASTSTPTDVANGDRVDAYFDAAGRMGVFSDRTNPATACGKTITYIPVKQVTTSGTTVLAAASPGNKHKILGCILTLHKQGTLKFTDGAGDLTGAMNIALDGGFVLPNSIIPYTETATNSALSVVTTSGAANGVVIVLTEA